MTNNTKTDEHHVKRGGDERWRKCQFLSSPLGTEEHINRRKILATAAYIFESKQVSLEVKMRP